MDPASELRQLKKIHEEGLIDEITFQRRQQRLLDVLLPHSANSTTTTKPQSPPKTNLGTKPTPKIQTSAPKALLPSPSPVTLQPRIQPPKTTNSISPKQTVAPKPQANSKIMVIQKATTTQPSSLKRKGVERYIPPTPEKKATPSPPPSKMRITISDGVKVVRAAKEEPPKKTPTQPPPKKDSAPKIEKRASSPTFTIVL